MANIFLSYDRDDDARARPIAALLEKAGHSVWWDRQIKGGGEFGAEIEAALDAADKIVVLWSERAVKSAWVRDEAAVGRDTGRLVPVTIDGTRAPIGFRQFQTIDLSNWRGRGKSPQVDDLLNAVETDQGDVPRAPSLEGQRLGLKFNRPILIAGAIVASTALAAVAWQFRPTAESGTPTFAVLPADSSGASKQLASDVAIRVAGLDDPSSADFRVVDAHSAGEQGSDYALKIGADSANGSGAALTLVSSGNAIIWSKALEVAQASPAAAAQVAAIDAQRALSCAADALSYRRERIDQKTLKLYVSGCARFDAAYGTNNPGAPAAKLFQDVVAKAPHFAPAWSKLFAIDAELVTGPDRDALVGPIRGQLDRAKKLGIDVAEAYVVRAQLLSPVDFLGIFRIFDEGIKEHPDSALLFRWRGERYSYVGRMNDAVGDTGHAVQLDPLSPANQETFASELAYSGDAAAGYEQLLKAEKLWPNSLTISMARYRMDLRFGDPKEARSLYRTLATATASPAQAAFIEARINPTPQNIEAALEAERKLNRQFPPFISSLVQALAYFGRKDEVIDLLVNYPGGERIGYNAEVLFRPAMRDVWRDPRSMAGAAHTGLLHYWKVSGNWPDFCFDPKLPYDCKKEAAKYKV
jgi:tetratricopeptide (TPR) repeat protein